MRTNTRLRFWSRPQSAAGAHEVAAIVWMPAAFVEPPEAESHGQTTRLQNDAGLKSGEAATPAASLIR